MNTQAPLPGFTPAPIGRAMPTLDQWLAAQAPDLAPIVEAVARACARIGEAAALGPLADVHGATDVVNCQGEEQKKLDVFADEALHDELAGCPMVAGMTAK